MSEDFANINKISREELERRMSSMDKDAVEKKLRKMGMRDIADRLSRTSNDEIMRMVQNNPEILKKLNQLMGGK